MNIETSLNIQKLSDKELASLLSVVTEESEKRQSKNNEKVCDFVDRFNALAEEAEEAGIIFLDEDQEAFLRQLKFDVCDTAVASETKCPIISFEFACDARDEVEYIE